MELFNAQFRIQREACDAAGRYIPLVVENVRGAQPWVGRAQWHYGSYYLWGDVPALMPMTVAFKSHGMNWSDQTKRGQDFTRIAGNQALTNQREHDAVKFSQSGDAWFDGKPRDKMLGHNGPAAFGSRSNSRKAASALIAKIPFPLALHIAQVFKPTVQP